MCLDLHQNPPNTQRTQDRRQTLDSEPLRTLDESFCVDRKSSLVSNNKTPQTSQTVTTGSALLCFTDQSAFSRVPRVPRVPLEAVSFCLSARGHSFWHDGGSVETAGGQTAAQCSGFSPSASRRSAVPACLFICASLFTAGFTFTNTLWSSSYWLFPL